MSKLSSFNVVNGEKIPVKHPVVVIKRSSGRGIQSLHSDQTPRIEVIQHAASALRFIPNAKPGIFYNKTTEQVYGDSLTVVPVQFERQYLIYIERGQDGTSDDKYGGGFRGKCFSEMEAMKKAAVLTDDTGRLHNIKKTDSYKLLLVHDDNIFETVELNLSKSKLRASVQFNELIKEKTENGDLFSNMYLMTPLPEMIREFHHFNFQFTFIDKCPAQVFTAAEEFYNQVRM